MKILVTGGAGFIGSHLMRLLAARGHDAVALDNLSAGRRENLPGDARLIVADVLGDEFDALVGRGRYDAIVHLAGQTLVSVSLAAPMADAAQNIGGGVRVLEAARRHGVKRVIFASTAAAYGDAPEADLPLVESHALRPMSFYGLSKVTVERYLAMYHDIYGLEYVALRFANVYGERQGNGGEGGVVSIFAQALAAYKPLTIYGDGGQTRDFVYAGDIALGIEAALLTENANANATYNLSTATQVSLRELIATLSGIAGREIVPRRAPARPGDIYHSALSNEAARCGLRWQPAMPLADGLRRTCDYFARC